MNFMFSSILGLENAHASLLWQMAENYLSCRQKALQVQSFEGKKIRVISARDDQPFILKALKIASYVTIVLPIFALIVRTVFRSHYALEIMNPSEMSLPGQLQA